MPDWLMVLLGVGFLFGFCVFVAACGLDGKPGALGCGVIIFAALIIGSIWHGVFGSNSIIALIALVLFGGAAISGYENWKRQKLTIPPWRGLRATILLRNDWLSGLIGALLW
jgi:hypothetical protein